MTFIPSFNTNIMPRDAMGNIELQTSSSTNTLLIVDTYDERITKKYAVRFLDTQFQYFKFPATTIVSGSNLNINLDAINLQITDDILFAKYVLSEDINVNWAAQSVYGAGPGGNNGRYGATGGSRDMPAGSLPAIPSSDSNSENKNDFRDDILNTSRGNASGKNLLQPINFNSVEAGNAQLESAGYKITQIIKQSGKDLRFRIQIKHYYESGTDLGSGDAQKRDTAKYILNYFASSSMWFSVIKTGTNGENKQYRGAFTASFGVGGALQKTITKYETQTFILDTVIPNSEFTIGDVFKIGGISKYYIPQSTYVLDAYTGDDNFPSHYASHKILKAGTYWSVTDASINVDQNNILLNAGTTITGSTNTTGSSNPIVISGNTGTGIVPGTTTGNTNVGG